MGNFAPRKILAHTRCTYLLWHSQGDARYSSIRISAVSLLSAREPFGGC